MANACSWQLLLGVGGSNALYGTPKLKEALWDAHPAEQGHKSSRNDPSSYRKNNKEELPQIRVR